jgi:hypothetical protein
MKMTIDQVSTGVLIISLGERRRQKGSLPSLLSRVSTSSFNLRLWPLLGIHRLVHRATAYNTVDDNQTTPLESQSSHNKYGLWFQNSSLIMSQCCSAILVDSCLVLWFPCTLGDPMPSSDPMGTSFCRRYWRIDKRSGAMNVPMWGSHMCLFRAYLQGKFHSHRSHHLRADSTCSLTAEH